MDPASRPWPLWLALAGLAGYCGWLHYQLHQANERVSDTSFQVARVVGAVVAMEDAAKPPPIPVVTQNDRYLTDIGRTLRLTGPLGDQSSTRLDEIEAANEKNAVRLQRTINQICQGTDYKLCVVP